MGQTEDQCSLGECRSQLKWCPVKLVIWRKSDATPGKQVEPMGKHGIGATFGRLFL
jgi:hypothetical protein